MILKSLSLRNDLVSHVRDQLIGPTFGNHERLSLADPPHKRYVLGVLYPQFGGVAEVEDSLEDRSQAQGGEEEPDDSAVSLLFQRPPASAGITFAVSRNVELQISVGCAYYEKETFSEVIAGSDPEKKKEVSYFVRRPFSPEIVTISSEKYHDTDRRDESFSVFNGRGRVNIRWRFFSDRCVVTATLINAHTGSDRDPEQCLFQTSLRVECLSGDFLSPLPATISFDAEEEEIRFRYRHRIHWASGHGCSGNWGSYEKDSSPHWLAMEFMPHAEVQPFDGDPRLGSEFDTRILKPDFLSQIQDPSELRSLLESFSSDFGEWLTEQESCAVSRQQKEPFTRILSRLREQHQRLKAGIDFLCDESRSEIREAFCTANEAMLLQMEKTALIKGRDFDRKEVRWYPFQLAFQLLTIPGIVDKGTASGRDIVDLLWFPTGGGKTEAYLLLAAFTIIYRRKVYGDRGGGTALFSRYTLRLLTAQQFERTATLTCALEKLRREGRILGSEKISIGLWIGGGKTSSPNTLSDAVRLHDEMLQQEDPVNHFMLLNCPWCGHSIIPKQRSENRSDYGIHVDSVSMKFNCTQSGCDFSNDLPVSVVDEVMYQSPPTILLGTIDKFARLPWEGRSRAFFGLHGNVLPPDLVIQDELHLISGPLGTIAAIYEAGNDVLVDSAESSPKVVAATATIRGASDQCRRLYGREVRVFPSPGINADDSYFMRELEGKSDSDQNPKSASRMYVGIMGQAHTPVTATVRSMAAMLDAGGRVTPNDDFWTLVAYHNSRRELGKTQTLARDDIPARIQQIAASYDHTDEEEVPAEVRGCHEVKGLSGDTPRYEIPIVLENLEKPRESGQAIDVLACTSMISVGVDVGRLNQMIIVGQPKTTAEYIQASSRVGRSRSSAGLVFVQFSGTKVRDRSHYESFLPFHESIYRWVEPTSVTPQADPALDRALHAVVIQTLRLLRWPGNEDAKLFVLDHETRTITDRLRNRLKRAIPEEDHRNMDQRIDRILSWWESAVNEHEHLRYQATKQHDGLLQGYGAGYGDPARETLNSMRNVDGGVVTFVAGSRGSR